MSILKPNSIANEYYLGNLPGTLQYSKKPEELANIANIGIIDSNTSFTKVDPTKEHLARLIPNTKTGRAGDWELLAVFEKVVGEEIWIKGAMRNKKNGCIALMTTTNRETNILRRNNRAIKSIGGEWFVGHYRMLAPMNFWRAVAEEASRLL